MLHYIAINVMYNFIYLSSRQHFRVYADTSYFSYDLHIYIYIYIYIYVYKHVI